MYWVSITLVLLALLIGCSFNHYRDLLRHKKGPVRYVRGLFKVLDI